MEPDAAILLSQFDHLDADVDNIANLDRTAEVQGLRDVDRARAWQAHANEPGNKARGVEPVNNSAAKAGLSREMLRQMDRIVIARKLGKVDDVFILDRLAGRRRSHAERKIFEIERLEQRILHVVTVATSKTERKPTPLAGEPVGRKAPRRL